jgi:hypothetical protein
VASVNAASRWHQAVSSQHPCCCRMKGGRYLFNQNAYIEHFNYTFCHGVLKAYLFNNLQKMREVA